MQLFKSFIDSFWMLLSNPYFVLIIIFSILMTIYYTKFRGYMGEFWVKIKLKKLPSKEYIVLNDIMLELNGETHQIDHIVVSKCGIFVIEMKNYFGMIIGDDQNNKWIQYLGKNKYYFKNPIHQNYGHVKVLEELLNIDIKKLISIVCFSNQAKMKTKTKNLVVQLDYLVPLIKKFTTIQINDDINEIANKILKLNITNRKKRKLHVKNIKKKLINSQNNSDICPKCGSKLVNKNGKYGTFIGCSYYPKCKYIKK